MDFHRLVRRELQTLCKKNKIPANMTNVAMAEALKVLETVEGIEEFLQSRESDTAQSSIETPMRSEVTSPYVPLTGGRSTRRRNVVKEEPEIAKPVTRSRRRTLVKDSDASQVNAIETPAVVARTNRKKASMASACRKMDSQLKECVEEEKDTIMTPASLGVTSRRRAVKKESAVKIVYSTRRSARLAGKNVGLLKEVDNENPGPLKKDLFAKDHDNAEMHSTGNLDDLDAISEISGGDKNTNAEENSEKKDEVELVSAKKQDISLVSAADMVSSGGNEIGYHFEADGFKPEVKECSDVEIQEVGFGCETEAEFNEQNCDKTEDLEGNNVVMPLNVHNEVQESDESHDVHTSEIEITVEDKEEPNTDKDVEEHEVMVAEQKEGMEVVLGQTQDISIVSEGEMVISGEEETGNHFEADGSKPELKEGNDVDTQEVGFDFGTEAEFNEQKCDITEDPKDENIVMPMSNELQESNGDQDISISEGEMVISGEEETGNHFEADGSKPEAKEGNDVETQEVGFDFETEAEFNKQKSDRTEDPKDENIVMPMSNELQESNGSPDDLHTSELEITIEDKEEPNNDRDAEYEGMAAECTESIVLESEVEEAPCDTDIPNAVEIELYNGKAMDSEDVTDYNATDSEGKAAECIETIVLEREDNFAIEEASCNADIPNEIEKELYDDTGMGTDSEHVTDFNVKEEFLEIKDAMPNTANAADVHVDMSETELNPDESLELVAMEAKKESADAVYQTTDDSFAEMPSDLICLMNEEDEEKMKLNAIYQTRDDAKKESPDAIYQTTDDSFAEMPSDLISLMNEEEEAKRELNVSDLNDAIAEITDKKDPIGEKNEINSVKDTEEPHEIGTVQNKEIIASADEVLLDSKEESADATNEATNNSDINLVNDEDVAKMKVNVSNAVITDLNEMREKDEINLEKDRKELHEIGFDQHEENTKSADQLPSDTSGCLQIHLVQEQEKDEINLEKDTNELHENGFVQHKESTKSADQLPSDASSFLQTHLVQEREKAEINLEKDTNELHEIGFVQHEESTVSADQLPSDTSSCFQTHPVQEQEKHEINLEKDTNELHEIGFQHKENTKSADQVPSDTSGCLLTHPVQEQDLRLTVKPTSLTPIKSSASKASATKKRMTAPVSDDKENIGSGSKLVLAKERVKTTKKTSENVQNFDQLSVRKLAKMVKEKLTITDKESKNENENENENVLARPALQALPENR